jgi:hypothetical protein
MGDSFIVCYTIEHDENLADGRTDHYTVFLAGDGEAREKAQFLYDNLLLRDNLYSASITKIVKSTDYEGSEDEEEITFILSRPETTNVINPSPYPDYIQRQLNGTRTWIHKDLMDDGEEMENRVTGYANYYWGDGFEGVISDVLVYKYHHIFVNAKRPDRFFTYLDELDNVEQEWKSLKFAEQTIDKYVEEYPDADN